MSHKQAKRARQEAKKSEVLHMAGFYYRPDPSKSYGFELRFTKDEMPMSVATVDDVDAFMATVLATAQKWLDAEASEGQPLDTALDIYQDQCDAFAHAVHTGNASELSGGIEKWIFVVAVNVLILSSFGRIPNDNYNGTQFMSTKGPFTHEPLMYNGVE